jgi:hypothetical protein
VRLRIALRAEGVTSVGAPQAAQVCAQDLLAICSSEEKRWKQGILDFLTSRAHTSDDLTVRDGWSWDGMTQRSKKSLGRWHTGVKNFFSGTQVSTIFFNGIQVKPSKR